jgi:hypothetical protein
MPVYKRPPYRRHKDHLPSLEWIFKILQGEVGYGGIARLAELSRIPASTIQRWKAKIDVDPTWRPTHEAYSDAKRIFTSDQEERLLTLVTLSFLEKGLYYSDADFRVDALRFHQTLIEEAEAEVLSTGRTQPIKVPPFECSPHFIQDFRKRHNLSLRRPRLKRRPGCTDQLQPLDRRVFGVLKAYARQMWRTRYHATNGQKVTKPMVAERLSEAWNRITTSIIDSAWCIYLPEWDEDQENEEAEADDPEYRQVISIDDVRDL